MDNPLRNLRNIAEKTSEHLKDAFEYFDSTDPLIVLPFRGYASDKRIFLKGRVLEDENIFKGKSDSEIRNIINSFKRFETDEVPDAPISIEYQGQTFDCKTDAEGFFTLDKPILKKQESKENQSWEATKITLAAPMRTNGTKIAATGEIFVPATNADYGIITDIDDTILQTHVTSLFRLKMLYTTFFKNAHQRLPVEGMRDLLQSLAQGKMNKNNNPVFYVSHSPWNIYDLLEEFLQVQDFPKGPILLRDYGLHPSGPHKHHKTASVSHILRTYPQLPFVLLGDSAEEDADFYLDIAKEFPERIQAIFIRKTRDNKNAQRIQKLIEENTHVDAYLVDSSTEMSELAVRKGLIAG